MDVGMREWGVERVWGPLVLDRESAADGSGQSGRDTLNPNEQEAVLPIRGLVVQKGLPLRRDWKMAEYALPVIMILGFR